ncbi:MAG: sodium:proton antiporter [Nitrospirales bacterium]|nr:MAG: sodium:proton antiporter [Nitrospirales bacterium]
MPELSHIAIILLGIVGFAILSRRLEGSIVTLPMFFAAFGWLIGRAGAELVPMTAEHDIIHTIAEITLVLALFSDASRMRFHELTKTYTIPTRMLLVGMPLTILLGTLLAHWVSPDKSWVLALLVAAILAPTDAALGQTVVTSPSVPSHLRQGINVESGLNDGLALPLVIIAALLAAQQSGVEVEGVPGNLFVFSLMQVTFGPLAGVMTGYYFAKTLDVAIESKLITITFQGLYFLCVAFLAFTLAELIGGNGFIAVFVGGLVFGNTLRHPSSFINEFMESEGQLLTIFTFTIFGAVLVPIGLDHATWKTLVLAIGFLSVVRMLPIYLSLSGLALSDYEKLFLGWFGPRGLASILFALLIVKRFPVPGSEELLACVVLTVTLSIVLHGVTAKPMSEQFSHSQVAG